METAITATKLNLCTLEGLEGGTSLPGISATGTLPLNTCDTDADCNSADLQCSRLDERPLCACFDGKDSCRKIGGCVTTPCKACNNCLLSLQTFVTGHAAASAAATGADFFVLCTESLRYSIPMCTSIRDSILSGMGGNLGRRAGGLCMILGACPKQLPDACWLTNGAVSTPLIGRLDTCTLEGVTGGTAVTGIVAAGTLPNRKCRATVDCGGAGFFCSMDVGITSRQCSCTAGEDTCEMLGR